MATRSIVTSQPVLACDMCGRRLLRGERPETFRAGAEPRTVCELCAPRAAVEGWQREADFNASLTMRPSRRRRGVSLLDRLRQLREPGEPHAAEALGWQRRERERPLEHDLPYEPSPYEPDPLTEPNLSEEALEGWVDGTAAMPAAEGGSDIRRALEIFNAGEHPRRVGGVARSLGTPAVTVRPVEGSSARFTIVVAWELCWYRYEIDLDDEAAGARLIEKGMELAELAAEDRAANAAADEHGELALAA